MPMSPPTYAESCHGTPITQVSGRSSWPSRNWRLRGSPESRSTEEPNHCRPKLSSATRATNAISMAATLMASCTPCAAPPAAASITFDSLRSTSILSVPFVSGSPSSGRMILERIRPAGAFITLAASRCAAMLGKVPCSMPTYAASTPPATVANPPTMTVLSSEGVNVLTNGLMRSGASVCPRKMFPAAESVSAPEVRRVFCMTHAIPFTTTCMMPR